MHTPRFITGLAAIAVLAAALVGCGGSGGESTAEAAVSLTKPQLIKRGDAICDKTDKAQEKLLTEYAEQHPNASGSSKAEGREFIQAVGLPPVETELTELQQLSAPESEQPAYEEILSAMEAAVEDTQAEPLEMTKPNGGPFVKPNKLAEGFGFESCSDLL